MQKEYFITVRLKDNTTKTYWHYCTAKEVEKVTCNLITKHDAVWGTTISPQDYACMACFIRDLERQGYTRNYELYK